MTITVLIIGAIAALAEIMGGVVIARKHNWPAFAQTTLLALGAGFMLALVFLKLLPTAVDAVGSEAFFLVLGGYALLHFFEHTVVGHLHFGEEVHADLMTTRIAGLSAFGGLAVHAYFDGLSISVGYSHSTLVGTLIAVAITLHKFPEGLTLGSIMTSAGFSREAVMQGSFGIGLATMAGVVTILFWPGISIEWFGRILAISAGTLLYVGASDLIPEINSSKKRLPPVIVFGGMLLYYLSDVLLGKVMG